MKKLLFLLMILLSILGYGQNLSLSELISIRKMSIHDSELFLKKKGWEFISNAPPVGDSLGIVLYVYKLTGHKNPSAESTMMIFYAPHRPKRLSMQVTKKEKYLEYINEVKKLVPEPISKKEGGMLKLRCIGKTTTFQFTLEENVAPGDFPFSGLLIAENDDFKEVDKK